jgi:hypothetical protein
METEFGLRNLSTHGGLEAFGAQLVVTETPQQLGLNHVGAFRCGQPWPPRCFEQSVDRVGVLASWSIVWWPTNARETSNESFKGAPVSAKLTPRSWKRHTTADRAGVRGTRPG